MDNGIVHLSGRATSAVPVKLGTRWKGGVRFFGLQADYARVLRSLASPVSVLLVRSFGRLYWSERLQVTREGNPRELSSSL